MILNFRTGAAFANKKAHKYFKNKKPSDIKNILVIRHAAIGDFVVIRPFLIELKKYFFNAKITLSVISSYMYGIPEDLVDQIHIIDKNTKNGKKTSFFQRLKQIKKLEHQNIMFDLSDSALTLQIALFANIDIKIGFPYRASRRLFYDIATLRSDFVLETISVMHQLNILGANTQHYPLEYQLTTKTRNVKEPYIIYFAGASMQNRCWDEDKFVKLIKKLRISFPNYKHIILKGIKDDEHFDNIYKPFVNDNNVIHKNPLPLEEIYDYLAKSTLVIVGDTGIRNMAIASNTKTLGIMWAPYISPLRYCPKTLEHHVVFNSDFVQPLVDDVYNCIITKDLLK